LPADKERGEQQNCVAAGQQAAKVQLSNTRNYHPLELKAAQMKFMVAWKTRPGLYKTAVERVLKMGAIPPKGIKFLGRWHVPGSIMGWYLMEGDDATLLAQRIGDWADVMELEVNLVIEDVAAAEGFRANAPDLNR
jgi:hypothetical protein